MGFDEREWISTSCCETGLKVPCSKQSNDIVFKVEYNNALCKNTFCESSIDFITSSYNSSWELLHELTVGEPVKKRVNDTEGDDPSPTTSVIMFVEPQGRVNCTGPNTA